MSPYQKKQKDKRRKNLFRKWHRRMGFTAAFFLINLAITGILLNHSDDLKLHEKYIESDWIVDLYGITPPDSAKCVDIHISKNNLCQLGEKIYLDEQQLVGSSSNLIGLVELDDLLYLATSQGLYIYTQEFELVEKIDDDSGLPTPIDSMSLLDYFVNEENIPKLVITSQKKAWQLDQNEMQWKTTAIGAITPVEFNFLKDEKLTKLQNIYLDNQITYLKFIQDLHSGRVFSVSGKLVTDLAGIIIIVLVFSGFYAWQRRKNKTS